MKVQKNRLNSGSAEQICLHAAHYASVHFCSALGFNKFRLGPLAFLCVLPVHKASLQYECVCAAVCVSPVMGWRLVRSIARLSPEGNCDHPQPCEGKSARRLTEVRIFKCWYLY